MQRVLEAAEKAKIELSGVMTASINLPFLTADRDGPKHMEATLTRAKFDELTRDLVDATMGPVQQAMADSGLKPSDLGKVLLVGGSSRIPAVQEAVRRFTGKEPFRGINPDECVAMGAALQGGVMAGEVKNLLLLDVTPLSLGIETVGNVFSKIIERNSTLPIERSQIFTTAASFQRAVEVHVLQGERMIASENKTLGKFRLNGIRPAMRGVPQIENEIHDRYERHCSRVGEGFGHLWPRTGDYDREFLPISAARKLSAQCAMRKSIPRRMQGNARRAI